MSGSDDALRQPLKVGAALPPEVTLSEVIEEGGQGVVYRGAVDGQLAAVKIYRPGQIQKRIDREVAALGDLTCPSIVRLLWAGKVVVEGQDLHVVATRFIEGRPLSEVISVGPLSHDQLGIIGHDVALAIKAMWERRAVHRDLKPGNIMLRDDGRACVIDLGLARHVDKSSVTQMGYTAGTIGYMSPEQARAARDLSCKSDLFALGVILVEAAQGGHPTSGDQDRLLAIALHQSLPAAIAGWKHAALLRRLLAPRPPRRPRPDEVLEALNEYAPG